MSIYRSTDYQEQIKQTGCAEDYDFSGETIGSINQKFNKYIYSQYFYGELREWHGSARKQLQSLKKKIEHLERELEKSLENNYVLNILLDNLYPVEPELSEFLDKIREESMSLEGDDKDKYVKEALLDMPDHLRGMLNEQAKCSGMLRSRMSFEDIKQAIEVGLERPSMGLGRAFPSFPVGVKKNSGKDSAFNVLVTGLYDIAHEYAPNDKGAVTEEQLEIVRELLLVVKVDRSLGSIRNIVSK